MGDDVLKQAQEQFGHLKIREIILLNAVQIQEIKGHVEKQNGRIGKLETKTWLIIAAIAVLFGEGILKLFAF